MNDFQNDKKTNDEEISLNISDILKLLANNRWWFVLSSVLCIAIAVLYIMWAPKVYERTATVLIKDDNSKASETALFQDLSIFEGKSNVNNEMIVLKSRSMMEEAVRRLKLDVSYTERKQLRTIELYSTSPVAFAFEEVEEAQTLSFKAKLLPDSMLLLYDLIINEEKNTKAITVKLGDTVGISAGKMVAVASLWYDATWFNREITVAKHSHQATVSKFRNALDVNLANKQTSVVNLSIRDVSTQRAEDVLNTVIAIYNEEAVNDKNTMAINTENFINERLIIIEKELGNVDNLITQYKTEHQLTDIQSDAQLALQESSKSDFEAQRLRNQRSMASYVRTYLADPAKSAELIPSNTGIEDINVETQIMTYNQSLLKRDRLMESSSERNPVVQDINNSLNSLRQSIIRTVDNLIVNLDIQIKSVDARNQRTRARISAVPRQEKDVTSISRQQQIKAQLYLYLLNKREENALNKAITESTARIIDAANGVSGPVAPRVMIIILAALIIGIAIPALIIYFIMVSDIMVRNRKDLVSALSIPFLGEVPYKKPKKNATSDYIAVREHGRDPVSEAFRIIRTNVDFMRVKQEHIRVIALTSYFPGSGKTFVAYNLAVSLAMTGKKVLLVDMDTRKGTLGKTIGKDSIEHQGLTSYLSRTVEDINLIINQDVNYPDIDIIYSGPEPPNPAELLLSTRLDSLFDDLRGMYDFIVTDNVPSGMVADAIIANRISDLTLYVVRAGKMDRRLLPEIERLYTDEKLRNMAVILNAVNLDKGYGYGGYGYGYGY